MKEGDGMELFVTRLVVEDAIAIKEFRAEDPLCQNCERRETHGEKSDCCWTCRFIGEIRGQEARVRLLQLETSKDA